ncbi:MAG: metallophosphoesterase [Polyangiaceae bacterium]|nr:metallophosphoesterase [Polyangiaceae bacterium]
MRSVLLSPLVLTLAAACGGASGASDDGAPAASAGASQSAAGQAGQGGASAGKGGAGSSQAGSAQAGHAGSGQAGGAQAGHAGSGQAGGAQAGQAGSAQAGQAGSAQAGQAGSAQAGQAGSAQAGHAGSAQAGHAGSAQAGQAGSAQAGQAGQGGAGGTVGGSTIRFVAIGDQGSANDGQKAVGNAMANKCATDGCDFALLLGDNFYDSGVGSTTDPQWQSKFVEPYAAMPITFYAVLGNHDNGGNGAGWDFARGDNEVAYTKVNPKWQMPARHYKFTKGPVEFFALDTNEMMYGLANAQKSTVSAWIASSTAPWRVALGHHPYLSNGKHGNAGIYEGIPFVPVTSGQGVKDFFDSTICGKVDVYLAGHDHSMQWLEATCGGTHLIVSGAGSKTTELKGKNPVRHQSDEIGFFYVVMDEKTFYAEMIDQAGVVDFSYTLTK